MKVLIVEDDPHVGCALSRVLRRSGFDILDIVASVQEGEAKLAETRPDILLLDRDVVGGVGWSLKDKAPAGCRVVLMSANAPQDSPPHYVKGGQDPAVLIEMLKGQR